MKTSKNRRFLVHRKSSEMRVSSRTRSQLSGFSRETKKIIKRTKDKTVLHIVKRKGHTELYDERKVYGSCYSACRNAHLSEKESEEICNKVCKTVTKWVKAKKIVSSNDIFKILTQELRQHNEDAAFLYETHRDIS